MAIIKSNKSCLPRKAGVQTIYVLITPFRACPDKSGGWGLIHGGEIKVETREEGEGLLLIVQLPGV
jgi:hypothetical protein